MHSYFNPFKENRTEQMKDLWKYYVPFPGLDGAGKPLVVEGGRGSGKTMLFQCNSWRQVLSQIKKNGLPVTNLFDKNEFVGIYYRVDTTFVSAMGKKKDENWNAVFETYLSICILQELLDLIMVLSTEMPISESEMRKFSVALSRRFDINSTIDSIETFRQETDIYLDDIENRINGLEGQKRLRLVNAHRFITDACIACYKLFGRDFLFKIFIDEYETLQEHQQKIINTLIKHSTLPVIFNIGLRPSGMKTSETISETETIEAPHDYESLILGIDSENYPTILKEICQKRILLAKEQGKIPQDVSEDIIFYLGTYKIEDELEKILLSKKEPPFLKNLKNCIYENAKKENHTEEEIQKFIQVLCYDAPILNARLHYALIGKYTNYTPTIKELYEAYINKNERYNDWMHNRKFGLIFLLCKEYKKEKLYYGFEVFAALSSGIVRYFLELCEQAFRIAFLDGYDWKQPIKLEIQSEAAKYVSEYKITDIAGYEPFGKELRVFVQYLGQIFYKLHTLENNTLGEPEPNHFSTKDLSLSKHLKELISSAIMWNVLQEGEVTKRKQSKLSPETVDYYMNKIYVPYFGISYRNQRKIILDVKLLEKLFSGDEKKAKSAFLQYFKVPNQKTTEEDDGQIVLNLVEEDKA